MRPGRYFWKLFLGNAALMALALGACVWVILGQFSRFQDEDLTVHLKSVAAALEPTVRDRLDAGHAVELDALAKAVGTSEAQGVRVTLVAADGTVLGDSQHDPATMESHADRPEIRQALREGWGAATRWSYTLSQELKYVAVRVGPVEAPQGVIRAAMAVRTIGARARSARGLVWTITLVALLAAVVLAVGLALLWSRRIGRITSAAQSISEGDLSAEVDSAGNDEVAALARAVNRMRNHLAGQLATIDRQRRVLGALLGQLQEGVVVAGGDGRIVWINPAAVRMLSLFTGADSDGPSYEGRPVEQCVAQHALQRMLLPGTRASEGTQEVQLEAETAKGAVSVLARASDVALPDTGEGEGGTGTGRLLVLTDITELARTMRVKTDFVVNASHELRTPLSAIRAAVETLARTDFARDPASAARFVDIIDRHSRRLEAMVADLLDLSRVESASSRFVPATLRLEEVCDALHERCSEAIQAKRLHWDCRIDPQCPAVVANAYLLQLVLDNLVDNAVKFTDPGGHIRIDCRPGEGCVAITVADDGCGIAPEEHDRVFERFYQVNRARGGTAPRGTGLGLSIVRHAVGAMHGTVRLDSEVGKGTRVTITIPHS